MRFSKIFIAGMALAIGTSAVPVSAKKGDQPKPAAWKVKGQGLIKNFALKRQLDTIFDDEKTLFEAVDIEDAALILLSGLQAQGFLDAKAEATLIHADDREETIVWDKSFSVVLPRTTQAKKVQFKLLPGQVSYFDSVEVISNNSDLEQKDIDAFFFSEGLLLQGKSARVFTPSVVSSGTSNIEAYLMQQGYQEAVVTTETTDPFEDKTYAKKVTVSIDKGPLHSVEDVLWNVASDSIEPSLDLNEVVGQPYSRFVAQDLMKSLRNQFYESGYPDVEVTFSKTDKRVSDSQVEVVIVFEVNPRAHKTVGDVSYAGVEQTKRRLLDSRVEFENGDPLNPILLEKSRLNLSRIGVFGRVDYAMDGSEAGAQDLEFSLEERSPWKLDVLAGWGSYEQLRGGITAERLNVWGLGHRLRFRSVLSMKSALGELRYLYPQIFNSNASVSSKLFALNRTENVYKVEQVGFDLGVSSRIEFLDVDADMVYTFESIEVKESALSNGSLTEDDSLVGSIGLRLGRDRRDNPINPRAGYRFTSAFEWASESLGGDSDYQLVEFALSKHGDIGKGLYWHGGISVGGIDSISEDVSQIPTGKLFRQGGENSIRGYKRGDASPIDSSGSFVGASSYVLANLELEQLLTDSISLVLFVDALGQTIEFGESPLDEYLYSGGLGIRFKTFMGPVRFEYGHNLDPREVDSKGVFHFSIGYPF